MRRIFKRDNNEKLGLVLSGGGSKGAYEIGAYLALRHLGKRPDVVTGTSIGAINGLLIVQNDWRKAIRLWKKISFSLIYDENSFPICDNPELKDIYKLYIKSFINDGGLDIEKLKLLLNEVYNPRKFFSSPVDYGLVTYNLSKRKPVFKTKNNLKSNLVKDYVLASASCYPAFKPYRIGHDLFIDGGYYDNMPVNLAIDLGATEVIAVDLRSVGFKQPNKLNVPITVITPRNKIVPFLVFDKSRSREAIRFGYNDTMKTFGKLEGNVFTFRKRSLVNNYKRYGVIFEDTVHKIVKRFDKGIIGKILSTSLFKTFLADKLTYENFNKLIEKAGQSFGLPEDNIYNIRTFNKALLSELSKAKGNELNDVLTRVKERNVRNFINAQGIIKLFFEAISKNDFEGVKRLIPLFADEFLIAIYLYVVRQRVSFY